MLTTEYPPYFGGGIGTYCKQWCRVLAKNNESITVFLPNKAVKGYRVRNEDNVRIVEFSPYFKDTSSYLGFETMLSYSFAELIKEFIDKEGAPDWLEAQEYNGIAYFILQRKQLGEKYFKDLNVLITCHAPSFLYFEFNHINTYKLPYFWIGEMEKYCIQAADICISPSQYLIDRLKERLDIQREIYVLHNPYEIIEQNNLSGEDGSAVFVAKLSPSKGIIQTLKSFKRLWSDGYKYRLTLVGDKSFFYHAKQSMMGTIIEKDYQSYIDQGLLSIMGSLDPNSLQKKLVIASVVLVPSTIDNFPYTVVESMANGKVVVASKQGGHQEIIKDGVNGFSFDHEVEGSFIDNIKDAFSLSQLERQRIGENAIATVREECDPQTYYVSKINLLNINRSLGKNNSSFQFIRFSNCEKIAADEPSRYDSSTNLTVVVPYYNMGKYVGETITSIFNSSYKSIEVIIINDGSDDDYSIQKLDEFKNQPGVKVITQQNKGLAEARNTGALEVKSKYLAFLDPDDVVHPDYYARAIEILEYRTNVHFVGCWVKYFDGSNSIWPSLQPEPPYLLYHNMVNSSGLIYRTSSFVASGFNDKRFVFGMEDYDSVISLVKNGYKGVVIPDELFYYRVRKDSMARGFNNDNEAFLYQLLAEKHKKFFSDYSSEIANLLNANGPGFNIDNPTLDHHLYSTGSSNQKYIRKVYGLIKRNPLIREFALRIYSKLN